MVNDRTPVPPRKPPRPEDVLKQVDAAARKNAKPSQGGVKETIESILIAFIFAFMFRAFVVEAFVIPTGSMATTLLGAHMRLECPDCGYSFKVNYSAQGEGDDLRIPPRLPMKIDDRTRKPVPYRFICENCGYLIGQYSPDIHFGDRILVLKYLYLLQEPSRWDVVVFKSPASPEKYDYTQNYIKRLVGKPNESVMVLDGDVYIGSANEQDREKFQIQTKPRIVQESLWRIVYDNDHHPRGLERNDAAWQQPWKARETGNGWTIGDRESSGVGGQGSGNIEIERTFRFENAAGAGAIYFDRQANSNKQSLKDWLAYDQYVDRRNWRDVADLKLDLDYQRQAGDGPLRLKLGKFDDTFIAEIFGDRARLLRRHADGSETVVRDNVSIDLPAGSRAHLEFVNVDYQVSLRINGRDVFQTNPNEYQPNVGVLLSLFASSRYSSNPSVEIEAAQQSCAISHLRLWRDIYYLNDGSVERSSRPHWASPDNVIHLGDDEYFVLGDNSQISGDARYWGQPIQLPDEQLDVAPGKVPGRFLLGKAFFVYWPAGYPPIEGLPGIVPNFGEMRFIH